MANGRRLKFVETRLAVWVGLVASLLALVTAGYAIRGTLSDLGGPVVAARWAFAVASAALAVTSLILWWRLRERAAILRTNQELRAELLDIINSAGEKLYCVGSRARDHDHLHAIVDKVSSNADVEHVRVLCGLPHYAVFREHLRTIAAIQTPTTSGRPRVRIAVFDDVDSEPEQFVCANERRALIVCSPLGRFGRYDSAVVVTRKSDVACVHAYVDSLLQQGRPIRTGEEAAALALARSSGDTLAK